jgi:hypothetical protein
MCFYAASINIGVGLTYLLQIYGAFHYLQFSPIKRPLCFGATNSAKVLTKES